MLTKVKHQEPVKTYREQTVSLYNSSHRVILDRLNEEISAPCIASIAAKGF